MTFIDFLWIAVTFILGIQLIAALLGLLMAAWWLEYQDKAKQQEEAYAEV